MPASTSSFWDHPITTLEKAINIRKQIEALKSTLADIVGSSTPAVHQILQGNGGMPIPFRKSKDGRKGKRSAAARAKMAAAQKARWAKIRGESTPAASSPKKKRRTMSPEARAKIAAAQRARWAKMKG
jgi:hypothetical protein